MKATREGIWKVRLTKGVSVSSGVLYFPIHLLPKPKLKMQKHKISQAIQKGKVEDDPTDGIFVLCNFVFSTTRITALKIHRLERDGFTGEGSASVFASIKSMGMLLFASMKPGPSPYLTVLKCYKTAGSNQ